MATLRRVYYTRPVPPDAVRITSKNKPAVRFSDADGKSITAPCVGSRCRVASAKWYGQYTDANGKPCRVPLSPNKGAAQMMLNDLLQRVEMEKAGHTDPCREHRKTPLSVHLTDWLAVLTARGRGKEYTDLKKTRVDTILDKCEFLLPPDLAAAKLERFLESLRTGAKKLSVQTTNDYLQAVSQFCNWMVENERMERNPFVSVKKGNAERDRRHVRRVLTENELGRLVNTTQNGHPLKRLTGPERAMLYTVAAYTGYRAGELAALTPRCFTLDGSPPSIDLDGAFTKNGKPACQPIPAPLAIGLRSFLAGRPAATPVWPGWWSGRAAEMIVEDATAAGVPLSVDTKDGTQVLDFHSLRGTFATFLDGIDISLKARQELMRHSDPRLTMNRYTRAKLHDLGAAVDKLPRVGASAPRTEPGVLKATGTEGGAGDSLPSLALPLALGGGNGWRRTETGEESRDVKPDDCEASNPLDNQGVEERRGQLKTIGAERAGFEPAVGFYPHAALAKRCFRPLSHLSKCLKSLRFLHSSRHLCFFGLLPQLLPVSFG